jgi:hypothetical protein
MHGIRNGKPIRGQAFGIALYDPATGRIVHVHRVIAFDTKREITPEHVEQRARHLAAQAGRDVAKLKALAIDPAILQKGRPHKVDLKTSSLVEIPMRALRARSQKRKKTAAKRPQKRRRS